MQWFVTESGEVVSDANGLRLATPARFATEHAALEWARDTLTTRLQRIEERLATPQYAVGARVHAKDSRFDDDGVVVQVDTDDHYLPYLVWLVKREKAEWFAKTEVTAREEEEVSK